MASSQRKTPGAVAAAPEAFVRAYQTTERGMDYHSPCPACKCMIVCARKGDGGFIVAKGRNAQALIALAGAGEAGLSTSDFRAWGPRLPAYCFVLRHRYGLRISTVWEERGGVRAGRYILETPVEIINPAPC